MVILFTAREGFTREVRDLVGVYRDRLALLVPKVAGVAVRWLHPEPEGWALLIEGDPEAVAEFDALRVKSRELGAVDALLDLLLTDTSGVVLAVERIPVTRDMAEAGLGGSSRAAMAADTTESRRTRCRPVGRTKGD